MPGIRVGKTPLERQHDEGVCYAWEPLCWSPSLETPRLSATRHHPEYHQLEEEQSWTRYTGFLRAITGSHLLGLL